MAETSLHLRLDPSRAEPLYAQIQAQIKYLLASGGLGAHDELPSVRALADGTWVPEENRELFVFERRQGEWKIARYMFNKTS